MDNKGKTIFCDLDGTLVKHMGDPCLNTNSNHELEILDGTLEKLKEWDSKGYCIIITTGRKESMRDATKKQLDRAGIFYDQLVMGFGGAVRYIINDRKPNGTEDCAIAINVDRNVGIKNISI